MELPKVNEPNDSEQEQRSLVWIKGPATLVSEALQQAVKRIARCHRGQAPPEGDAPSSVVICHTGACPEGVASEVATVLGAAPEAAVVVLGPSLDAHMARAALRAGARGFLHAGMPSEQVARAVSVAEGGEVVLPRELLKILLAEQRGPDLSVLRERPREILELMAEGLTNAQIARKLHLSESSVKQHLSKTYKALGVNDRNHAAMLFRRGTRSTRNWARKVL